MTFKRWILLSGGVIGLPLISAGAAYSIFNRQSPPEPPSSIVTSTPPVESTPKTIPAPPTPKVQGVSTTDPSPSIQPIKPLSLPSSCIVQTIYYQTTTVDDSTIYPEQTYSVGGTFGSKNVCFAGSDGVKPPDTVIAQPIDRVTHNGTKPHVNNISQSEAMNLATSTCSKYGASSFYQTCIDAEMAKYGY